MVRVNMYPWAISLWMVLMSKINPGRQLAVAVLTAVDTQGAYANIALDEALRHTHISSVDAGLATTIVYGVLQHQLTLDWQLAPFYTGKKIKPWVRIVLWTALYQMQYLDRVPDRAIFFDSTEIAKEQGNPGLASLVNGVLRNAQRKGFRQPESIKDPVERLSITASLPRWLVQQLLAIYGLEKTAKIAASVNSLPRPALRMNTPAYSVAEIQQSLAAEHITTQPSQVSPVGLVADGGHLAATAAFRDGMVTLQDESSMLVAPTLDIQPDDQVLDACAAPGGKTTHIASFLDAQVGGRVTALDIHAHKVQLIMQNAKRLHMTDRIEAETLDARAAAAHFGTGKFSKILVDAPCSGLGLLRRKPEIRYTKNAQDIAHLPAIQGAILDAVAPTLTAGGTLVYSTCTILPAENQEVVTAFLQRHPDFHQVPTTPIPAQIKATSISPALQLTPDDCGSDGFFIAKLVKNNIQ